MPLPSPVLFPPFNIVRLSHMAFDVTDLAASKAFWSDMFGLVVTAETARRARMELRRLKLTPVSISAASEGRRAGGQKQSPPRVSRSELPAVTRLGQCL